MKATATSVIGTVVSSFVVIYVLLLLYGASFHFGIADEFTVLLIQDKFSSTPPRPSPKPQNQSREPNPNS